MQLKVIQPNCRVQFSASDVQFVIRALCETMSARDCLVSLLSDEETRDQILDDEALLRALLEDSGCLQVSARFYFYVLVRHALLQVGISDRAVADYVAEVLSELGGVNGLRAVLPGSGGTGEYLFELIAGLQNADERTRFVLRAHIGDCSLFLAGVFPDRIKFRAEIRGAPDLSYYEGLGRSQYRAAGDHRLAQRYDLARIFHTLSEQFETARHALNGMSDRLLSLGDANPAIDQLLSRQN